MSGDRRAPPTTIHTDATVMPDEGFVLCFPGSKMLEYIRHTPDPAAPPITEPQGRTIQVNGKLRNSTPAAPPASGA